MNWFLWESRRAFRDRAFILSGVLLAACLLLSFIYGHSEIAKQEKVISKLGQLTIDNDHLYFKQRFEEDEHIGRALYYLSQPIAHKPLSEAVLSIGQRDLHSYHQTVKLRSLYMNLFDSGFSNPFQSASGHFDFSFVIIFLLPLFIIATTFDSLSRDRENGVLSLLLSQGSPVHTVLWQRLLLRFVLLSATLIAIILPAFVSLGISLSVMGTALFLVLIYMAFWFALVLLVNSRGWSSSKNAGVLLGLWVLLTVFGPSTLNLMMGRDTTRSGAAVTLKARQMINNGWDIDKQETADKVLAKDKRYLREQLVQDSFHWSWYYAMHDAADFSVEEQANQYFAGLEDKYKKTKSWSLPLVPVRIQMFLSELASTDLLTHLNYYNFVKSTRQKMRDDFLPRVIADQKLSKEELLNLNKKVPFQVFEPQRGIESWTPVFQTAMFVLLLLGLAIWDLRRLDQRLVG